LLFAGGRARRVTVYDRTEVSMSGSTPTTRKTAKAAAAEVLRRAGEPLKTAEIVERVLKMRGVKLGGKTPAATIAAILATENKKPDGLFVRTAPGIYTLREQEVEE
jgi:hypothetical protein